MKRLLVGMVGVLLLGCCFSFAQASEVTIGKLTVPIPQKFSPEDQAVIWEYAPRISNICPGFAKYGEVLEDVRFESYSDEGIDLVFKVSDRSKIPSEYLAFGHTCYFRIFRDGTTLSIAKRPCQSVCFDKNMKGRPTYIELPLP